MPSPNDKPPVKKEQLSEEDAKLLGSKTAEFKEKVDYLSKKYRLAIMPILMVTPYGIVPKLTVEPMPDFFKENKKKIITPFSPFSGRG